MEDLHHSLFIHLDPQAGHEQFTSTVHRGTARASAWESMGQDWMVIKGVVTQAKPIQRCRRVPRNDTPERDHLTNGAKRSPPSEEARSEHSSLPHIPLVAGRSTPLQKYLFVRLPGVIFTFNNPHSNSSKGNHYEFFIRH